LNEYLKICHKTYFNLLLLGEEILNIILPPFQVVYSNPTLYFAPNFNLGGVILLGGLNVSQKYWFSTVLELGQKFERTGAWYVYQVQKNTHFFVLFFKKINFFFLEIRRNWGFCCCSRSLWKRRNRISRISESMASNFYH
jgi:hypothetical protein